MPQTWSSPVWMLGVPIPSSGSVHVAADAAGGGITPPTAKQTTAREKDRLAKPMTDLQRRTTGGCVALRPPGMRWGRRTASRAAARQRRHLASAPPRQDEIADPTAVAT